MLQQSTTRDKQEDKSGYSSDNEEDDANPTTIGGGILSYNNLRAHSPSPIRKRGSLLDLFKTFNHDASMALTTG